MGKSAGKVIEQAAPVVGGAVAGIPGAIAGVAAGGGSILPSDPFGSKAAQSNRERLSEELKDIEVTKERSDTFEDARKFSETEQVKFDPRSRTEQALLDASVRNFSEQQRLVDAQERDIAARGTLQEQGRGVLSGISTGEAFGLTEDEQSRIAALRDAEIAAGSDAVNRLLTERLGALDADLARRGVRGQAASQLQGDLVGEAAESLERRILEANRTAADQAIRLPSQRVQTQAQVGAGLADFQTQAQQQAIQNRQLLQDPIALQQLRDERIRGGKTVRAGEDTTTKTQTSKTKSTGEGAASAIAAINAGSPSVQQSNIAGAGGIIGTVGKAAGSLFGAF